MSHTPGPWEVVALNGFGPFAIRMPTPQGTKQPTHYGIGQIGTAENASLVAAAPDLLATLKAISDAAPDLPDALWKQVDASISKAEAR